MTEAMIAPRYAKAIASRYATTPRSGFPIPWMKTVEEVRRLRLAELRAEAGSLVALNDKLGLNARDATLSQILNQATNSRTGTPKQMGSKLAREIEKAFGKEVGWMDTDPSLLSFGLVKTVAEVASAINQLPDAQRDWVLTAVRNAIELAKETIVINSGAMKERAVAPSATSLRRRGAK